MNKTTAELLVNSHFLIVDDQAFVRGLLQTMLVGLGARNIRTAINGEEALNKLSQIRVNCVISDWNMTPVNGLELLRRIRTKCLAAVPANLPFILFTGFGESSVISTAMNLDVSACLVKPASAMDLAKAINTSMTRTLAAKSASLYGRVEIGSAPIEKTKPESKASDWAKWVREGKREYCDGRVSHIDRNTLEPCGVRQSDAPLQLRNIRHKTLDAIKPGQVLVEDLNDDEGVALLVAGTIITDKILARLKTNDEKNGARLRLWVGRLERPH